MYEHTKQINWPCNDINKCIRRDTSPPLFTQFISNSNKLLLSEHYRSKISQSWLHISVGCIMTKFHYNHSHSQRGVSAILLQIFLTRLIAWGHFWRHFRMRKIFLSWKQYKYQWLATLSGWISGFFCIVSIVLSFFNLL